MFKILVRPVVLYNTVSKLPLRIATCSLHSNLGDFVKPYVNSKYSYAFGRGTNPVTNENINYYLNKLEAQPVKEFIISYTEEKHVTNHEFVSDVRKLASGLYNTLKLKKGDTICLWSLNCYDWLRIYFACQSIGITVCTVNPYYREHELAYALTKCKAKALFLPGSESKQNQINKFMQIFNSDHTQTELKNNGHISNLIFIDENKADVPLGFNTYQLNELAIDQKLDEKIMDSVNEDVASIIMYTSGTTGLPKAVVLNNHSIINNAQITSSYIMTDKDDIIILPLPLFHSYSLVCGAHVMVARGIKTVLTGYRFDVKNVVDSINKHSGTFIMVTPTMIIDMVNYVKKNKINVPTLRTVLGGAASFPPELYNSIKEVVPHLSDLRIGYGMTETSPVVTVTRAHDTEVKKQTTVGQPIDYIEVKIIDPITEETVKLNEEGELLVRGHNIMVEYYEDIEKTNEILTKNRWLKTGDRATMDAEGFVKICGRSKEMIIKGGENIYPVEIEDVLHKHPDIIDAYAFAVPDKRLGEVVGVWIKLLDPKKKITEDDIKAFCKKQISSYKVPTYVIILSETDVFPTTSTGKVKKFELTRITCEKLGIKM